MPNTLRQLDALVAKVRALPESRQQAAIDALAEIADEPYQLSADEMSVLLPALEEARRGENLVEAATDVLLNKSWA